MSGEWIKLEHATPNKPEVYRLSRLLGISRGDAFLLLVEWWMWLDRNSCNGNVTLLLRQDVDQLMHCAGFATAMEAVGWLVFDNEQSLKITNFERHNGKTAKERALTKDRMQRMRDDNVTQIPSPEKRREEVKIKPLRAIASHMAFDRFWEAWPRSERKVSKAKCREVWTRRKLDDVADEIVRHVAAMRDSRQWRDGYDPAPLTYLNQRRWEDELPASAAAGGEARGWE